MKQSPPRTAHGEVIKEGMPGFTPHRTDAFRGRRLRKAAALQSDSAGLHPVTLGFLRQLAQPRYVTPHVVVRPRGK